MFWLGRRIDKVDERLRRLEVDMIRLKYDKPEPPKWPPQMKDPEPDPEPIGMVKKGEHLAKIIDVETAILKSGSGINIKIRMELPYDQTGEVQTVWTFIPVFKHPMAVTPLMYLLNMMMQQEKQIPIRLKYKAYEGRVFPQVDIRWDKLMDEIGAEVPNEW